MEYHVVSPQPYTVTVSNLRLNNVDGDRLLATCDFIVNSQYIVRAARLLVARNSAPYVQAASIKVKGGAFTKPYESLTTDLTDAILTAVIAAYRDVTGIELRIPEHLS